jgi:hypothetical protein
MISATHPLASWFLVVNGLVFLVVYALPLTFAPLVWARWFQWELPSGRADLTVYFGRCTGVLAITIVAMAVSAAPDPRGSRWIFELIGLATGLMTLLHAWGLVRRIQPWTEHLEILLYGAVCAGSIWLRLQLA